MQKLYLTCIAFLLVCTVNGQVFLTEDFSGGIMPPSGWNIENLQGQWSISSTTNSGGTAPEAKFHYTSGTITTRLISNTIDLTGLTTVMLSFNHFYDWYANPAPAAGVATRSGGSDWNTVWEVVPTANTGPENKFIEISNADVGASDFQLCFFLSGNMLNLDFWFLDDILLYNAFETDAMLSVVHLPEYAASGAEVTVTGTVKNAGYDVINSFDVVYRVDGGDEISHPVTGLILAPGQNYTFTHPTLLVLTESGSHEVEVNIVNVNGGEDDFPANNIITKNIWVVPFIPAKRVFCEEATGTWCGQCVRGICFMDYMAETYPDTWIGAAVHNNDPMVYAPWDTALPDIIPNFSGFPCGTVDRAGNDHWDPSEFEAGYLTRINTISPATIEIINYTYHPETRLVAFDLSSEFVAGINHELRFAAVIIEDSVWGTTSGYNQVNSYFGGGNGPMCGFESLPAMVPAALMHYDHVGRAILDTPFGTEGSLPVPISAGAVHSYHYSYTLPDIWVYEKLHFVGLLINMTNGEILNSTSVLGATVGIEEPVASKQALNIYPNPVRNTANISFNLEQPDIVNLEMYNQLGEQVYKSRDYNMGAGQNRLILDLENYRQGMYFVKLAVGNQRLKGKINMVR